MKIKEVVFADLKELLFLFVAFSLMFMISCLFANSIVENHLVATAVEALCLQDSPVMAKLEETELMLLDVSLSLQNDLNCDHPQHKIEAYMVTVSEILKTKGASAETGVYGSIRGEFMDGAGWIPPKDYVPHKQPWYVAARNGHGAVVFTCPYHNVRTGQINISVSKALYDAEGSCSGVAAMDVEVFSILEHETRVQ
jgi:hypothetical protein